MKGKQILRLCLAIYGLASRRLFLTGLLLLGILPVSSFAQRLNITKKGISITEVLEQIKSQSGYDYFFNESAIRADHRIDIDLKQASLADVLNYSLKDLPLSYSIENKTIVISRKEQQPQERFKVRGRIMDTQGKIISGISVSEKGNTKNTVANDSDGTFIIYLTDKNSSLELRCVGYESITIPVRGKTWIEARLKPVENLLEDVVVTGYQNLEKRSLTGSISSVNMKQLEHIYQPNIDKLLQGQVPGLTVISTSGAPGSMPQIRIRGTATLSGNVQPLWVVDGIILDDAVNVSVDDIMTNRNLIASGIGGVNVEDIESINVLKDAAATSIYGTRAANGVIVITSKKGKAGRTRVNFTSNATMGRRPMIDDAYMMNSKDRIDVSFDMIRSGVFNATSPAIGEYNTVSDFQRHFIDLMDKRLVCL